jgi:uncharacterized protein YebE (UPF0316 family)
MPMEELLGFLRMAGLAVMSVGLWTLRVALTARGRRVAGSLTAALEAVVFLVAFSRVMSDMEAIERVVGYASGVAVGTLLGVMIDERLSAGQSEVRIVTEGSDHSLATRLHSLGWPVTLTGGMGPLGETTIAFVAVDDTRVQRLVEELERSAPEAFWTVERLKSARAGKEHDGWIQIRQGFSPWRLFHSGGCSRSSSAAVEGSVTTPLPRATGAPTS